MKIILRNFFSVLKRFKVATILNVLGLTIAFAAFILIMIQVNYDYNFNKNIQGAEQLFRVKMKAGENWQCPINRPSAELLFNSSPHILNGAIVSWPMDRTFETERGGKETIFKDRVSNISENTIYTFPFEMIEGTAEAVLIRDNALIPESLARKLFGKEPAVNEKLIFGEISVNIGGVYKDFPLNSSLENIIYLPLADQNKGTWGNMSYMVYLLLDHPASAEPVLENFESLITAETLVGGYGIDPKSVEWGLNPFTELHFIKNVDYDSVEKSSYQTIAVLIAIAFVLLLIAAINYTNFSMALTPMRVKSINTQKVMGASQGMLRGALIMEALVLCLLSFLLSLGVVYLFSRVGLSHLVDGNIALLSHVPIVLITGLIALLIALCAGFYPAYYITSFPTALVLKGNFGLSPKGRYLRSALISFQFISSFALIIGASFMFLQNHFMQHAPLGYDRDELIVTTLSQKIARNPDVFVNEIKDIAGVENITYSEQLLSGMDHYMGWGRKYRNDQINYQTFPVEPSFLTVMNIPVTEGRNFRPEDANTAKGAYIFNERARHAYGLELGEKIDDSEIIGFIQDIKLASFRREVEPMAFYVWGTDNWGSLPSYSYIKVRAGVDLKNVMKQISDVTQKLEPGYPFDIYFFDAVLQQLYEKERTMTLLITLFSLVAIFISIVGVFGLVIFESQYRIKEIGIRKVMGSTSREVVWMFNRIYLRLLVICFILAAPIGYIAVTNWLENFAYRTPIHWWVFPLAFVVIGIITSLTVTFQNWRIANSNPVESIKTE